MKRRKDYEAPLAEAKAKAAVSACKIFNEHLEAGKIAGRPLSAEAIAGKSRVAPLPEARHAVMYCLHEADQRFNKKRIGRAFNCRSQSVSHGLERTANLVGGKFKQAEYGRERVAFIAEGLSA